MTASYGWATNLKRLRSVGARRVDPSAAFAVLRGKVSRGAVLLDIGCGDSRDRFIAERRGVIAYGIDLFPPSKRVRLIGLSVLTVAGCRLSPVRSMRSFAKR